MKKFLNRPCSLTVCPDCGRVKKFGQFVSLSIEEIEKVVSMAGLLDVISEACPECVNCTGMLGFA